MDKRPYRYQYSYAAQRAARSQPPKKPKRSGGIKKLAILLAVVVAGASMWFWLQPGGAVNDAVDGVKKAVKKEPEPTHDTALQSKINAWVGAQGADYGISVREITGKMRFAAHQPAKQFVPASTFKPFVAYTILHNIEQGQYTLQDRTYKGNLINYCLDRMILVSDNQCAYELERLAGFEEMDTFIHAQGFTQTTLDNYDANGRMLSTDKSSTAADLADFMWRLHAGTLLNKEHTEYLLDLMKKQEWRERIPAGVPEGIEVADKPGWLPNVEADMGIVYGTKSTYVIAILSGSGTNPSDLAELSELVYNYLNDADTQNSTS